MNEVEYMRLCCVKKDNISLRRAAMKAGISPQNLGNKIARDSFYLRDIRNIADALGAELKIEFIDKETGKPLV